MYFKNKIGRAGVILSKFSGYILMSENQKNIRETSKPAKKRIHFYKRTIRGTNLILKQVSRSQSDLEDYNTKQVN